MVGTKMGTWTLAARMLLVVPLLAVGLALGEPRGAAAATVCGDTANAQETISGTTRESIVVLAGAWCNVFGVVRGGITVEAGAHLAVHAGTEVRGSITATSASDVRLDGAVVRGSVTVTGSTATIENAVVVQATDVRGDLVVTGFHSALGIGINASEVRGSVVLRGNVGADIVVIANVIDANLDCAENSPDPTAAGFSNTIGGAATGQCAGMGAP